jgi:uroporphyrinogen decarboxylase
MNKRERVLSALRGEAVDRVPISFWGHHYVAENSADGLADETLRQLDGFDWDFLKPQSRAQAFAEMWGLTYTPSARAETKYTTTHVPLTGAGDLERLQPADATSGALGEQLQALRKIREAVGASVPIIWTVFSPLMICRYLLTGDVDQVLEIARTAPDALAVGLEAVTETLVGYVRGCLANGADGVFYATNLARRGMLTTDECAQFQRPYDLRVLAEAASAPFNVMHVCGRDALFDVFVEYPVNAFSFALAPGNPGLREAHLRTGRAVMGGFRKRLERSPRVRLLPTSNRRSMAWQRDGCCSHRTARSISPCHPSCFWPRVTQSAAAPLNDSFGPRSFGGSVRQLRPAGRGQEPLRPDQPVPYQPEHQTNSVSSGLHQP